MIIWVYTTANLVNNPNIQDLLDSYSSGTVGH